MFTGSLVTATFGRSARRVLLGGGFALGVLTLLLAGAPSVWIAAIVMVPLGASSMAFLSTMNSTLQLNSSDSMRGRVMALYFVLFLGSTPVGAPVVGFVAETFSPRAALALGATATIAACVYGLIRLPRFAAVGETRLEEPEPGPEALVTERG